MSRSETGKSSIVSILGRFYLFFMLLGSPLIWWATDKFAYKEGQMVYNDGLSGEHNATAADVWRSKITIAGGWVVGITLVWFIPWTLGRIITHTLMGDDPEYRAWVAQGGDPYFDNMSGVFNPDTDQTRAAMFSCPTCGVGLQNSTQCGNCGTYWDATAGCWMMPAGGPTNMPFLCGDEDLPPELRG